MINYISVKMASVKWNVSERSVRNYCAKNRINGAILYRGGWLIPEYAEKPKRSNLNPNRNFLLEALREEKKHEIPGRIYHKVQVDMTYNSNHIEGSRLTHDQTRYIFETRTISGEQSKTTNVDELVETINHFTAIDRIIDFANYPLSQNFIKELHGILKRGTKDSRLSYFAVGDYKRLPNEVGGLETTHPELVLQEMNKLMDWYNKKQIHSIEEIIEFHVRFEKIHPFQDGNGRVGRLIAFKECLKNNIVPFIILDEKKEFYYRGLKNWNQERGWLVDTCLDGQDTIKSWLDYFNIHYEN